MKRILFIAIFWGFTLQAFTQIKVSIVASNTILKDTCTRLAVEDATKLFSKTNGCIFSQDTAKADVILFLPKEYYKPSGVNDIFFWSNEGRKWLLNASCPKGVANGLYAIMQEILGFKFYHPREIFIPDYNTFKIPEFKNFN